MKLSLNKPLLSTYDDVDADESRHADRVNYLEETHRKHLLGLDLLNQLSEVHRCTKRKPSAAELLDAIHCCLSPLLTVERCAILLVNDEDASFHLGAQLPESSDAFKREIEVLMQTGDFAWAVNHNGPQTFASKQNGRTLLLNVLATSNQVHGMFVALINKNIVVDESIKKVVAVALNNCAHALENASLYSIVSKQRDDLEVLLRQRTRELEFSSQHDLLTGLVNRRELVDRLDNTIRAGQIERFACAHLDIDGLSRVNQSYGYGIGDRLLVEVAKRLQQFFKHACERCRISGRWQDITLARVSADEFCALFPLSTDADDGVMTALMEDLTTSLNGNYSIGKEKVRVTFNVGASIFPQHGLSSKTLLSHAEVALNHIKRTPNTGYLIFRDGLQDIHVSSNLPLEGELQHAIENDELFVCYQPKIDLLSEEIVGAEALLRWRHPQRGLVSPDEFIPVAESSGLIGSIGDWVLRRVCRQLKQWEQQGFAAKKYSVNLSQMQMQQRDLVDGFLTILEEEEVPTEWLEFELTETTLTSDVAAATRVLTEFHKLGFSVSLDDFGTGHSSLTLLKQFPLDTIKIDRSFIRDLNSDPDDAAIVNAVVTMGHNLRLRVVAEGVETREQLHFLRSMGCHEVQGFYIGRPVIAEDYVKMQQEWHGLN